MENAGGTGEHGFSSARKLAQLFERLAKARDRIGIAPREEMNGRAERGRINPVLGRKRRKALARRLEFFSEDVAPHKCLGQRWRGRNARLCEMRDGCGAICPNDAVFEQRVDHPREKRVADDRRAPFNPCDIGRQLGQMRCEDRLASALSRSKIWRSRVNSSSALP